MNSNNSSFEVPAACKTCGATFEWNKTEVCPTCLLEYNQPIWDAERKAAKEYRKSLRGCTDSWEDCRPND